MADQTVKLSELLHFFPRQMEATEAADTHHYTLYGGAAGPGKSYWLRWYPIRRLIKWGAELGLTGIHGALFSMDYGTLKDRQISKMEVEMPKWLGEIRTSKTDGLAFHLHPKYGSHVLCLRNLDDPSKYLSSEFAIMAVEELTENDFSIFNLLRLRNRRTGIEDPCFVAATNPGGQGHADVKKLWIDRDFPKELKSEASEFIYVKALHSDNPHLAQSYVKILDSLPEKLRKAYRDGNWDVFEGQYFCCDEDTEIMTKDGFKGIDELSLNDMVAVRKDGILKYEKVNKKNVQPFSGEMVKYATSNGMDFMVTPNHRMLVKGRLDLIEKFIPADKLGNEMQLPRGVMWSGTSPKTILLSRIRNSKLDDRILDTGDFMEFMGWYLSEGSLIKNSTHAKTSNIYRGVSIAQTKKEGRAKIEAVLNNLGFKWMYHGHSYEISDTSLVDILKPLGDCYSKYIPREYLFYGRIELKRLFDGLMGGDGCPVGIDGWSYFTCSKRLADDVQEIAMKLGNVCTISERKAGRKATFSYNGVKKSVNAAKGYVVVISGSKRYYGMIHSKFLKREKYNGRVWCVSTDTGVILLRRNGKCVWTGNSEWDKDKHVCRPFEIPETWLRFRSIDPSGRSGVTSCHWYTLDRDGCVYCYREHYSTGMDMDEHAEKIKRMSIDRDGNEEVYQYTVMDTAAWAKAGYSETGVEIYMRHGVGVNEPLIQSDKHRIIGWNSVHTYLRIEKPTGVNSNPQPKLKIFSTCSNMIREIPMARHDEVHPEDIDSTRTGNEHWDALDDLRYMLQSLRESRAPKQENAIEKRIRKMNEGGEDFWPT